jgi:hypothetical protein
MFAQIHARPSSSVMPNAGSPASSVAGGSFLIAFFHAFLIFYTPWVAPRGAVPTTTTSNASSASTSGS